MDDKIKKLNAEIFVELANVERALRSKDRDAAQGGLDRIAKFNNILRQAENLERMMEVGSRDLSPRPPVQSLMERNGFARQKQPSLKPSSITVGTFRSNIRNSNEILVAVANWIIDQGKRIPTSPNFVHDSEHGFASSAQLRRLKNEQFIEVGQSKEALLKKTRQLLNSCGYGQQQFEVTFADGSTVTR